MSAKNKKQLTFKLVTGDQSIQRMIIGRGHKLTYGPTFDCLVWGGGEDITPFLYGQKKHPNTGGLNFERDLREVRAFRSVPLTFPKIGICRGAQLLNVLSGGDLWQHVDNHGSSHEMKCEVTGQILRTTSIHHQMMDPENSAWVIATARQSTKLFKDNTKYEYLPGRNDWDDPEAVYYGNSNSFCIQGHPEYAFGQDVYKSYVDFFWYWVEVMLFPELAPDDVPYCPKYQTNDIEERKSA